MSKKNVPKRPSSVIGIKSLIAGAAVVTTIAGWAILPQNDPQYASADNQEVDAPVATATLEPTSTPTEAPAYPTVTAGPASKSLLTQPTGTPTTATNIQVAPGSTTEPIIQPTIESTIEATVEPTSEPTAIAKPTAKPIAKPRAVTRTRSSK